jgi:transketolase
MSKSIAHQQMANAIRALSIDAIEEANSGHPGLPLGMADVATVLFSDYLKYDASDPQWHDRDRFVLSGGHGSMLLYSLLYLLGYDDIRIEDLKKFRQLGSKTAGHPEYGHLKGIETTTGPLGQGVANAVGMAITEKMLSARYGSNIVNHMTYVMAGDGDLMEGISQEAITLAGHLGLNKLIMIFDDNRISIDGPISKTDSTDQTKRFEASGWEVIEIDGHNINEIADALNRSIKSAKPSMIKCRTIIGYGSPNKEGKSSVHGSPLGNEEYLLTRDKLGINYDKFAVPNKILEEWRNIGLKGCKQRKDWEERLQKLPPEILDKYNNQISGTLNQNLYKSLIELKYDYLTTKSHIATRKASEIALQCINENTEILVGGSADLTGSNNTKTHNINEIVADNFSGRYIHYGIREHAMGAIMNGISLHKGFIPYGGTFLIFSDYCRPAIRLGALMEQHNIYVLTHDSIGLGEDGPTHQPIEHLSSLRAIPNVYVYRPASAVETIECWELILKNKNGPSLIALSRQNLQEFREISDQFNVNSCEKGIYLIKANSDNPDYALFASGSEVEIAIDAYNSLTESGMKAAIYSVPCLDLFNDQDNNFKNSIIKNAKQNIVIEAGISQGWEKILGDDGLFVGMSSFGASGPYKELYQYFGLTKDRIIDIIMNNREINE